MADPCFPGSDAPYQLAYFTSSVSAMLTILITTGNFLIIFAIAKDPLKKLRNPFAFFLANAAASDLMVGVVAMPVSTVFHYMEAKRSINRTLVYILHLTYFVSASASLFSMAAMTIDRYYALMSLSSKRRNLSRRKCIIISALIWITAVSFSGFYFLLGFVTLLLVYVNISLCTVFGMTLVTYLKVIRRMHHLTSTLQDPNGTAVNSEERQDNMASPSKGNLNREQKVTTVFMSIMIAFISIYTPAMIFIYILQFCFACSCNTRHIFRDLAFLFVTFCSATNPLICLVRFRVIKKSAIILLKCWKRSAKTDGSLDGEDHTSLQTMTPDVGRRRVVGSPFVITT
ncbi:octopamine receptor beta-2R-like [Rhopilema esculentum]|uniref:octopamine receptor beta-2R-like n=1 Tax=Rhopilema esculentum TaxID=499914 RepID=UPI0031DA8E97|eukprot:gene17142-8673_t